MLLLFDQLGQSKAATETQINLSEIIFCGGAGDLPGQDVGDLLSGDSGRTVGQSYLGSVGGSGSELSVHYSVFVIYNKYFEE